MQSRKVRIIRECIDDLQLNLDSLTVFTEAATGHYAVTAPIAATAGAETVYALGRNSPYGSKENAFTATRQVAQSLGVAERIRFVDEKQLEALAKADLVTNSGFVRPLDRALVEALNGSGAISLMYEPWEFRGEVDIEACWDEGIPVVGTDESDPRVRTMEYVGLLPVQLSLENDIEVMKSRYLVLGGGKMAKWSAKKLRSLGATVDRIAPVEINDVSSDISLLSLDAVVIVDNRTEKTLLGTKGLIGINQLEDRAPDTTVFHICGPVNDEQLRNSSINVVPEEPADAGHMSFIISDIGPRPVIQLQTAGLAAGEVAARHQASGRNFQSAVDAAVSETVGADFTDDFKLEHGHPNVR